MILKTSMKLQPLYFDRRKVLKIWFVCQYHLLWHYLKMAIPDATFGALKQKEV